MSGNELQLTSRRVPYQAVECYKHGPLGDKPVRVKFEDNSIYAICRQCIKEYAVEFGCMASVQLGPKERCVNCDRCAGNVRYKTPEGIVCLACGPDCGLERVDDDE